MFEQALQAELAELERQALLRRLPPAIERGQVCLSSNNYLGLATHPDVIEGAVRATRVFGASATGSRLLSGNLAIHEKLEAEVAKLKGAEAALLFNSGYAANTGMIEALVGKNDRLVCDKLNHASLIDGGRACAGEVRYYPHLDLDRARELLLSHEVGERFLATDTVFSMDGDVAPLDQVAKLSRETGTVVILDDAHGTGVLGAHGGGALEHFGLKPSDFYALIQMGTFGKALGSTGAFVAASLAVKQKLLNRARSFVFSTALPPSVIGASMAGLQVLAAEGPALVARLRSNSEHFRDGLRRLDFDVPNHPTPIVPVILGDAQKALRFSEKLRDQGVIALAVRPPSVPPGTARIRASLMASHTREEIEFALSAFENARRAVS